MAKVTGPLLSLGASGTIADTQTYAAWKGIPYVRRHVIPSNPNTADQQLTRTAFAFLQAVWRYAPAAMSEAFNAYAQSQPLTGRNALTSFNLSALRTAADLANMVFSPGARSGVAAASIALTPAANQITVDLTAPALPAGWTIDQAVAVAIEDQDPNTGSAYAMVSATDATDPYSIVLGGLAANTAYRVGGWFRFLRPDGLFAYGVSVNDVASTPV